MDVNYRQRSSVELINGIGGSVEGLTGSVERASNRNTERKDIRLSVHCAQHRLWLIETEVVKKQLARHMFLP